MPLPVQIESILNTYLDVKDILKLTAWPAGFILIQVDGGYCESVQALYSGNACAALTFSISKALNYQRGGNAKRRTCVCVRARACMYELYFYDFYVVVWNRLVLQIRNKKDLRYNAMICVKCLTVN